MGVVAGRIGRLRNCWRFDAVRLAKMERYSAAWREAGARRVANRGSVAVDR